MGTVYVDGEKVDFQGDAPEGCQAVCELIQTFLGNQGKLVATVEVDGDTISVEEVSRIEKFDTLSFTSISFLQHLLEMCRTWSAECAMKLEAGRQISRTCLRQAWGTSQTEAVNYLEGFRPLMEGFGVLQQFGSESEAAWLEEFAQAFENAVGKIDGLANAIEARSAVRVSDSLALEFVEAWGSLGTVLDTRVIKQLETQKES